MSQDAKIERFISAFDCHMGTCSRVCYCGKTFYNPDGGWDFGKGELEKLEADPNAYPLACSVSMVEFEGTIYVADCECWHERAKRIMAFLDSHAEQIADYLNGEKIAAIKAAEAMPTVKEGKG